MIDQSRKVALWYRLRLTVSLDRPTLQIQMIGTQISFNPLEASLSQVALDHLQFLYRITSWGIYRLVPAARTLQKSLLAFSNCGIIVLLDLLCNFQVHSSRIDNYTWAQSLSLMNGGVESDLPLDIHLRKIYFSSLSTKLQSLNANKGTKFLISRRILFGTKTSSEDIDVELLVCLAWNLAVRPLQRFYLRERTFWVH